MADFFHESVLLFLAICLFYMCVFRAVTLSCCHSDTLFMLN